MKNAILTLIAALAITAVSAASIPFTKSLRGSGIMETVTRNVPEYNSIVAMRGVDVILDPSAKEITVMADDNVIGYVVTEVEGRTLTVTISNKINNISNCKVTVTVPDNGNIVGLSASSAADIKNIGMLKCRDIQLSASSAADMDLTIVCTKCTIRASSGADIDLKADMEEVSINISSGADVDIEGKADTCTISASSGADCDAADLLTRDCTVSASSGASAKVNCSGTLNANATSGGSVKYTGSCSVTSKSGSGGRVKGDR